MKTEKVYFWDPYLKGIGQIMLQGNTLTGLLFLFGIFINSPLMALAAVVGAFVGTMTAKLLKYKDEEIENGLYGFNATLVGVALIVFFQSTLIIWIAIVVLAALSTVIMNFSLTKKIPVFTFPFIILTWIALFIFHNLIPIGGVNVEEVYNPDAYADLFNAPFSLMNHGIGFGEVIFQGSLISGLIFFIAVYINSPIAALYGLFGAVLSVIVAILFKDRIEDVKMGMFSFNAVLAAIAMSGTKKKDGLYVVLAVILSGITEEIMLRNGFAVLTFPFVMGTWLTLIVRDVLVKRLTKKPADS